MATKGYLRENRNAETLHRNIQRLHRVGIPLSAITVGGEISRVIDSMQSGDQLVVISVFELSPQPARQKILLGRIADRGIAFRPLDKAGAPAPAEPQSRISGLLRRLGLQRRGAGHRGWQRLRSSTPPPAPQMSRELKIKIIKSLTDYYQMTKNVEELCEKGGFTPPVLYQLLKEYDLPSRRIVQAMPSLNPLQQPGFPRDLVAALIQESGKADRPKSI